MFESSAFEAVKSALRAVESSPAPTTSASAPTTEKEGAFAWSASERALLLALSRAAFPSGHGLPAGAAEHAAAIERLGRYTERAIPRFRDGYRALLRAIDLAPVVRHRSTFQRLDEARARAFLEGLAEHRSHAMRSLLRAVMTPLKQAYFDSPALTAHVGCNFGLPTLAAEESPRWLAQVTDGASREQVGDARDGVLELEADVVVVGTGAGGASAAHALASRGLAVLMLEEGALHRRSSFSGRAMEMTQRLYRDGGVTLAWGNVGIPIWAGRGVGGSTLINSGTCYRPHARVFDRWRARYGLPSELSASGLDPYFASVESMLGVARADLGLTGGVGRVVARGAAALGMRHHGPLPRNAPGCDGQGICCFGCPTGAKRSTDVSYVPEALRRGAQLMTGARVERVEQVAGRARGVVGTLESGRSFRVRARAVVLAAGAMLTPLLLRASGLRAPMIGRNLSIHPATKVMALFDETIDMSRGIPQGYGVEDFADEGIMLEGASTPFDVTALAIPWVGAKFMELLARFPQLATFGLMVADRARGSVHRDPFGKPLMRYDLGAADLARMQRGIVAICELFLAAGARRVFPFVVGAPAIEGRADLDRLAARRLRASDVEVTAYHPLGTARIGADPRRSVCDADHRTHELDALYVLDGAAVPSSLGVNPQLTIMALAVRAAERLAHRLEPDGR
jgi:choline dehydrogenase-like flavoprotein